MRNAGFRDGAKAAFPIVLGYLPVGIAFGILAQKAGLTAFEAGLMSFLVYAGASQFIAVEMLSNGIVFFPIVLTTFFINLRHVLMSSALSLFFDKKSFRTVALLSAQLTDESFAVSMSDPSKISNRPGYMFGLQMASHLAWISGSVGGAFFGSLIDPKGYGLPFALPALFICLLVFQVKSLHHFWMMVIAGISSLFFRWAFRGDWYILVATLLVSGIGVAMNSKGQSPRLEGERE